MEKLVRVIKLRPGEAVLIVMEDGPAPCPCRGMCGMGAATDPDDEHFPHGILGPLTDGATDLKEADCNARVFSILHQSILSSVPIPSKSFKTAAVIAASGEDMTTVFVTVTVGSRSDSGKGADSNALDSTSLLSPATEK